LRYALTINPTVYVSHIRQFWSTARIKTTDEGTKILATVDGTPTEPHHIPSLEAQQTSHTDTSSPSFLPVTTATIPTVIPTETPQLRHYTRRARTAQSSALPTAADEPASLIGDDSQGEACPTGSMQHKLHELTDLCTHLQRQQNEMASKITAQDLEISTLKARIKHLEDRDGGDDDLSREDATIKERRLKIGEEAGIERSTEKDSNDTEEMANILTSLDASSVLTSRVQNLPSTQEEKEKMVESDTPKKKKLQEQIDIQVVREMEEQMEYEQAAAELTTGEKIELINELVKYQDHLASILKYKAQQSKPLNRKQQRDFYMSVLRSHAEEGERFKRKGINLEQESAKKVKTSEEVLEEDLKTMMQLVPVEELWALVKETLNIRQSASDKEKKLWVELKRLYEPDVEDQLWIHTQTLMRDPGNLQHALKDKGVIDSGCSRHMTWNMSYLSDFEKINGGFVAFGENPNGGKITDTECIVLSFDFKLPDENHVLLRVPRENNMYNVDLKNIVPLGDLTCLFANATLDEFNL
nr:hypothetical protein [Tanacetum cinerariifolium]